jgi:hypothetical protein
MDPRLDMLADVIVELVVREIETPSMLTRRSDGARESHEREDYNEGMRRMPEQIPAAASASSILPSLPPDSSAARTVGPPARRTEAPRQRSR